MYCESAGSATSQARLCAARSASRQLLALLQCRALAVTVTSCIQSNSSRSHLHPFREGNGRTQRIFFSQLAGAAGHTIDWTQLTPELNNSASKAGEAALADMLLPIVSASTEPTYEATAANLLRAGNAFSNPLDRASPRTAKPTRYEPPSAGTGPSMRR